MKKMTQLFTLITFGILSPNVHAAWDGITTGKIHTISVAGGENYGFRITLSGTPKLCGNTHTWAYLNESHSNYQTFVSVLLAAKMADKKVTLYTTKEVPSGNEHCRNGFIGLQ